MNDAGDIRATLEELGYLQGNITGPIVDPNLRTLLERFLTFVNGVKTKVGSEMSAPVTIVVYYAGHAIEVGRENVLIPMGGDAATKGSEGRHH